jgi:hypothetical protein
MTRAFHGTSSTSGTHRVVRDVVPIRVQLAWWRDDPPARLAELLDTVRAVYAP